MKVKKLDAEGLMSYALRLLGGRAHSAGELREKLRRRCERAEDIAAVMARLLEFGYVDDRKFAEGLTAARLEGQGLGKQRVLRELRTRRVAPAVASGAVDAAYRDTNEAELVEAWLARKFRTVPLAEYLAEPKQLASAYRRLRRAGFSAGTSIGVLKRHSAQAEALDAMEEAEEDER